ncbi:cysteine-rich receptor-like protein kinase 6 [Cryptomeria japonica]|uniref:cysteine-rich receptor-like protein kinase 6 n=1 Tax=Cryptomeria japonica TaxID=3369 RepID=UPI0027DA56E1|nr:cysteine-rich receptor-like protein kinase 6 [Cryptomeria japonica]
MGSGYMAPKYAMLGQLSVKTDVYSFGVLVLEVVSRRKNMDSNLPYEMQNLLQWAWGLYRAGKLLTMVGSTIKESCPQERVERCIHVALLCVQADAGVRPAMSNVVMMISSNSVTLPNPTKPAFLLASEASAGLAVERYENYENSTPTFTESQTSGTTESSDSGIPSVNKTSVTELQPR